MNLFVLLMYVCNGLIRAYLEHFFVSFLLVKIRTCDGVVYRKEVSSGIVSLSTTVEELGMRIFSFCALRITEITSLSKVL